LIVIDQVVKGQDVNWYKSEMNYHVIPPYNLAYSLLQTEIIDTLLKAPNTSIPEKLIRTLNCGVLALRGNLSLALDKSNTIRGVVDETVMQLVVVIAEWEKKIKQSQKDLSDLYAQVTSVQKQVAIAEQGVKDKQAGVNSANDAVRDAERAMEDAVNCQRRRRRRKRLFFNPSASIPIFSND
ncbi:unnamed protein product, partial [Rotaria socialis]